MRDKQCFQNKKLLVLTTRFPQNNNYPDGIFVKYQVDELKKYFQKITVIATTPYIPRSISKIMSERRYRESNVKNYYYDNVEVYYTRDVVLPFKFYRYLRGEIISKAIMKILNKRKLKPDMIHAHFTIPTGFAAVKIGKSMGIPVIVTIHEDKKWFLEEYRSNNKRIMETWKNTDALIRVNKEDVKLLKKINENSFYVPNGISPEIFKIMDRKAARKRLNINEDEKIIFSHGAIIERKGFQFGIMALKDIAKDHNINYYIGGEGPYKATLEKMIKKYNLEKFVHLVGYIPTEELPLWLNAADVFLFPSISESFGIAQLEALACGTPVVATKNGGSEEIIVSDDYGLLCGSKDFVCLKRKLLSALEKRWDRKLISAYAKGYTWEKIASKIVSIYENILCVSI